MCDCEIILREEIPFKEFLFLIMDKYDEQVKGNTKKWFFFLEFQLNKPIWCTIISWLLLKRKWFANLMKRMSECVVYIQWKWKSCRI